MRHACAGVGTRVYLDPRSSRGRRSVYTAAPLEAGEGVLLMVWERRKKPAPLTRDGGWKALPRCLSCSSAGNPLARE